MRGHNIYFHGEIRKTIFEFSSVSHLIWSSAHVLGLAGLCNIFHGIIRGTTKHLDADIFRHCIIFYIFLNVLYVSSIHVSQLLIN